MIVLDTNVVSEFMKAVPNATVVNWLHQQPSDEIWTTSITVFEIQYGLSILPDGKRKRGLVHQFELALKHDFDGRILDFDADAALAAADISANYKKAGQGADVRDVQIAGIVASKGWTLATRNTNDFRLADVDLVDPWQFSPST
jgi:predicted nucleic acid-binding protein